MHHAAPHPLSSNNSVPNSTSARTAFLDRAWLQYKAALDAMHFYAAHWREAVDLTAGVEALRGAGVPGCEHVMALLQAGPAQAEAGEAGEAGEAARPLGRLVQA